jgi:5S rRNA maturation endonuclease (ribonuclease M5)
MSFRRLSRIVEELSFRVEQGTPVLIEGKKDEEALKQLMFGVFENRRLQKEGFYSSQLRDFKGFSKSLNELGIHGNIIKVSGSGLKLFEVAEMAVESSSEVIILTDFDKKGTILAKKLSNDIQSLGSHPDLNIRKSLMNITRKYIKDIESLPRHIKQLELELNPYCNYI